MTDPKTPAEALESVRKSRAAVAERLATGSLSYDLIYSALVAGMVAGWAAPRPWPIIVIGACTVGLALLARHWARRRGLWVSGVTPVRARWVAIGLGAVMVGLLMVAVALSRSGDQVPAILGLAAAAAAIAFAASRLWLKVFRRETGADL
ncbi:MAG: hypothetical protein Q8L23_03365 [Caulobacter sp.]|nr:hypothetical protein [Caulobacter sp.]